MYQDNIAPFRFISARPQPCLVSHVAGLVNISRLPRNPVSLPRVGDGIYANDARTTCRVAAGQIQSARARISPRGLLLSPNLIIVVS